MMSRFLNDCCDRKKCTSDTGTIKDFASVGDISDVVTIGAMGGNCAPADAGLPFFVRPKLYHSSFAVAAAASSGMFHFTFCRHM